MKKAFLLFFFLILPLSVFASNASLWDIFWHVGETDPPTTTDDYNGECAVDTFVILTLTCSDGVSGSGCNTIYARVVGEGWASSIVNPWTFSLWRDGNVILEYYSVDNFGNVETVKAKTICFITTPRQTERYVAPYDLRTADLRRYYLQEDTRTTDSNRFYRPTDRRASIISVNNIFPAQNLNSVFFFIIMGFIIMGVFIWYRT